MSEAKLIPINDPSDVPNNMTEAEAQEFWQTHEMTEAYLEKVSLPEDDTLPVRQRKPVQSKPTSIRFEENTTERLKAIADKKGMAYQTLLKQFVLERLYEEEKREGIL